MSPKQHTSASLKRTSITVPKTTMACNTPSYIPSSIIFWKEEYLVKVRQRNCLVIVRTEKYLVRFTTEYCGLPSNRYVQSITNVPYLNRPLMLCRVCDFHIHHVGKWKELAVDFGFHKYENSIVQ